MPGLSSPEIQRILRRGHTRVTGGLDYGSLKESAHTSAGYLTMEVLPDLFITFAEYSKQGLASDDLFEWVQQQQGKWKVEEWWASHEQSRANALMRKAGVPIHDAPRYNGVRDDGIGMIKRLLDVQLRGDGTWRPGLFVTEDCRRLLNVIEVYRGEREDDDEIDAWRHNILLATKKAGAVKVTNAPVGVRRPAGVAPKRKGSEMLRRIKTDRRSRLKHAIEVMERKSGA